MDAEKLTNEMGKAGYVPFGTIDGRVLPAQLVDVFDRGQQAPVPILAGFNSGEIRSLRFLIAPVPADAATYETAIRGKYGDLSDPFLKLYPATALEDSMLAITRDAMYGWTAERLVKKQTAIGQAGFLYLFDHGYPAADSANLHAFHASELPYMFGTAKQTPPFWPKVPDTAVESALSDAMIDYWTSFAKTGQPRASRQAAWPAYGPARNYMHFAEVPRSSVHLMPGMYELHEEATCRRRASGSQPLNWNVGVVSPVLSPHTESCR
jgi:para-nitrobenzyl esterase